MCCVRGVLCMCFNSSKTPLPWGWRVCDLMIREPTCIWPIPAHKTVPEI